MLTCWEMDPSKRPKFSALKQIISERILSQRTTNDYVMLRESSAEKASSHDGEEEELESTSLTEPNVQKLPVPTKDNTAERTPSSYVDFQTSALLERNGE